MRYQEYKKQKNPKTCCSSRGTENMGRILRAVKVKQKILRQKDGCVAMKLKCGIKRQIKAEVRSAGTCPER